MKKDERATVLDDGLDQERLLLAMTEEEHKAFLASGGKKIPARLQREPLPAKR